MALSLTSCSEPANPPAAPSAPPVSGELQWIDPNKIQPGPLQRDSLTDAQMDRIRALQKVFLEVDGQSVDQWADNFKRDLNPDRELEVWEKMSKAYTGYCAERDLDLETKKEVYKVVLLRSMASEAEVLQRLELKSTELKHLSKEDAAEIMHGY